MHYASDAREYPRYERVEVFWQRGRGCGDDGHGFADEGCRVGHCSDDLESLGTIVVE